MTAPCKIAVAGAGLIGRRHAEILRTSASNVSLAAIVDPADAARTFAESLDTSWYPSLQELFANARPDGVILATPNQVHVENGLECIAARCPMMVEKPIAVSSEEAQKLVAEADDSTVPLLVGHHRRHSPIIQKARALIDEGRLGEIIAVHSTCWFLKPKEYFGPEWRRKKGAGPVGINAIHDIDLLRYLCGDISRVHAISSNASRGFEVEDTAAALLQFQSGTLGTFTVSDAIASPWSWEFTSGENPEFDSTMQSCYLIGGSKAALSVPDLKVWQHEGSNGHWKTPINALSFSSNDADPLVAQIYHFAEVICGDTVPLVSGEEGLKSLTVIEALRESAMSGRPVDLD